MKKLFCLVAAILLITACSAPRKDYLQKQKLLGEKRLRHNKNLYGGLKYPNDNYFYSFIKLAGDPSQKRMVRFYWQKSDFNQKDENLIPTALPIDLLQFIIDDSKLAPTVEFIFDEKWLNKKCRVRFNRFKKEKIYPNQWLSSGQIKNENLRAAIVRISRKDMKKEKHLLCNKKES